MENISKKQFKTEFIKMYGMRAWKERNRKRRVTTKINTGTRTMKSKRDYSRAENKRICREA